MKGRTIADIVYLKDGMVAFLDLNGRALLIARDYQIYDGNGDTFDLTNVREATTLEDGRARS